MKFSNATIVFVLSLFATSNASTTTKVGFRITSDVPNTVCTESETQMIEQSLQSHLQDLKNKALRPVPQTCTAPCATLPSDQLCLSIDPGCDTKTVENLHKTLKNPPANLEDYCVAACEGLDGVACETQYPACASLVADSNARDTAATVSRRQLKILQCPTFFCGAICIPLHCLCKKIVPCCEDWADLRYYCPASADTFPFESVRHERVLSATEDEPEEERQLVHSPDAFLSECHVQQQAVVAFLEDALTSSLVGVSDTCRAALQASSVDCVEF